MRLTPTATEPVEIKPASTSRDWRAPASPSRREPEPVRELAPAMRDVESLHATEDDIPVDGPFALNQMRLLADALDASYPGPPPAGAASGTKRPFLVWFNVRLEVAGECLAPDLLLSVDVEAPPDETPNPDDEQKSYVASEFGKVPDLVVEVVSNKIGGELSTKLERYAAWKIPIYIVFDYRQRIGTSSMWVFRLVGGRYVSADTSCLAPLGLDVCRWKGRYRGLNRRWLRWTDAEGRILLTGDERADAAEKRAAQEHQRAEAAEQRAEAERQRAEQLAAKLRALGIEP